MPPSPAKMTTTIDTSIDTTAADTTRPLPPPPNPNLHTAVVDSPPRPPVSPITPTASFAQLASQQLPPPVIPPPVAEKQKLSSPQAQPSKQSPPRAQSRAQPPTFARPSVPSSQAAAQTHAQVQPQTQPQPQSQPQPPASEAKFIPPPEAVDLGPDNTDEAALRSALAILQIQRDKARRDITALATLKNAASRDPAGFTEQILAGNLSQTKTPSDPLAGTLESDEDDDDDDDDADDDGDAHMQGADKSGKLPKFPTRQNIVRCPPVNWAKYHVVGDSLDRMHEDQRKRPTPGAPSTGEWTGRDHVVAAPYSPGEDRWALLAGEIHPMQTRKGSKKPT